MVERGRRRISLERYKKERRHLFELFQKGRGVRAKRLEEPKEGEEEGAVNPGRRDLP